MWRGDNIAQLGRWCAPLVLFAALSAPRGSATQTDSKAPSQPQPAPAGDFRPLLEQGFALHQQADYAHALPLLERAWKLDPHDYFANLLVGIDLLRTGEPAQSLSYLGEASRQRPDEDFPYEYLGEAHARLHHYADAAHAYERALAVAPASPQAVEGAVGFWVERFRQLAAQLRASTRGLAAEYRLQARSHPLHDPLREELLTRSASLDSDAPGIWSEVALANIAAEKTAEAEAHTARALEQNQNDLRAMEAQALLAARHGEWANASRNLDAIGHASPGALARVATEWPAGLQPPVEASVSSRTAAVLTCAQARQQPCAAAELAAMPLAARNLVNVPAAVLYRTQRWEALLAAPAPRAGDAAGWLQRGVAAAELGRCADAIPALERGISDSHEVYGSFLLSWCYAQEAGRVIANLQQAQEDDAALAHMVQGDVLLRMQNKNRDAIAEYQAALAAHPDDPELLERLAEAQYEDRQFAPAAETANKALRIDPYRFSAMHTLARIAIEQRGYADAVPYLQKIAAHDPQDASAQVELGNALAQTGNPGEAVQHLKPALAAGYPDEKGSLHAALGAAFRRLGRGPEAAQAFAKARELSEAYQRTPHRGENDGS